MPRQLNPNLKPVSAKKVQSGGTKRKLKEAEQQENQRLASSLAKYLKPQPSSAASFQGTPELSAENPSDAGDAVRDSDPDPDNISSSSLKQASVEAPSPPPSYTESGQEQIEKRTSGQHELASGTNQSVVDTCASATVRAGSESEQLAPVEIIVPGVSETVTHFDDPSTWCRPLPQSQRDAILSNVTSSRFPTRQKFPKNKGGFKFNSANYEKITQTGERLRRDWIVYSKKSNSLFCLPCCLFPSTSAAANLTSWTNYGLDCVGFQDFGHQKRAMEGHEESNYHFTSTIQWKEFKKRCATGLLIDQKAQEEMAKVETFGKQVLRGILDAILFLAKNNLSFRGSIEKIGERQSGNFLSLVELISRYYPPLSVHLAAMEKHSVSYLSHRIQDEFLALISGQVRSRILESIKMRKFYSMMLDSTPDNSHRDQISLVIRTLNYSEKGCKIEENFIGFFNDEGKKGEEITQTALLWLKEVGLSIEDCRGQGYDNGSNMSGKYKGVQARIKEINPLASFVPCAAHSLNLVGVNAASKNSQAKLLLGQVQNLYSFFSRSTSRWSVLLKHLRVKLQAQSSTRWSAKSKAVSAVVEQLNEIYEALCDMSSDTSTNPETYAEAQSQVNQIFNFRFLLGISLWEKILSRIDRVNLVLQASDISLNDAKRHLEGLLAWLEEFKTSGFDKCLEECKLKASTFELDIESGFDKRKTRGVIPPRFRDGNEPSSSEAELNKSPIEKFKETFFAGLMDALLEEMKKRVNDINDFDEDFSFLWGKKLGTLNNDSLVSKAKGLSRRYEKDFCCSTFSMEIQHLKSAVMPFLEGKALSGTKPIDILDMLSKNGLQESFYNCHTALRLFLTIPVTVASNERSFSKLKLIKNYLRLSMGQERLNHLAIISIEQSVVEKLSFDNIIDDFARMKARRMAI